MVSAIVGAVCMLIGVRRMDIARALDLVDRPDGMRKLHSVGVPLVGGLMFLWCALVLVVFSYLNMISLGLVDQRLYVISAIVLCHGVLGLTDDRYSVPAAARLIYSLSLTAAILATDRSLTLREIDLSFGVHVAVGSQFAYLLTLLFVVGFIYAINMIDGMNGVLGFYALLVTLFFATRLFPGNEIFFLCTTVALSVFLAFNLSGQVFAGDGGAYVVGAGGAMLLLHLYDQAHDTGAMPFDIIMVVVCIPVLDALRVSLGRLLARRSAFSADRNHLHHRLLHRFGPNFALYLYVMLAGVPMAVAALWPAKTWLALVLGVVTYSAVLKAVPSVPAGERL